ncbi:lipopolysaccharide biosynthesis protein [Turicibacter sanguinis]|uniref:lipopolysaccharide biosynthesis protein n=1 Tax=Turicibacter sanguinis TaxID=154288 RepID=UPI0018A9FD54|nr:lipopolysaccharide biosynthesis protein [Turicibacter sanguinis]
MEKNIFHQKNILFISPIFFDYHEKIIKRLESYGANVDFFDERPSNKSYMKALLRSKMKEKLDFYIESYYESIFQTIKNKKYDNLLVIKGEIIPINFIVKFREKYPEAKINLMMYDSIDNYPHIRLKASYFDKCFSFDKNDCDRYGFSFRPLFFVPEYEENEIQDCPKYDLTFIGTIHSDRLKIIDEINMQLDENLNRYYYFYIPTKLIYIIKYFINPLFRKKSIKDFKFEPLPSKIVAEKIKSSNVIIDIEHPNQTGLTMRTIEMLGAKKKIITTNSTIKEYDFYNPQNVYIIDRENIKIDNDFFQSPYIEIESDILRKYSIDGFLEDIFK